MKPIEVVGNKVKFADPEADKREQIEQMLNDIAKRKSEGKPLSNEDLGTKLDLVLEGLEEIKNLLKNK